MRNQFYLTVFLFLIGTALFAQPSVEVPENIMAWIKKNAEQNNRKPIADFEGKDFFRKDSVYLVGYLKGYDTSQNFSTGIIYAKNIILDEDFPTVVKIFPDGRFETKVPVISPCTLNMNLKNAWADFYAEPGQTIGMVIDWNEYKSSKKDKSRVNFYGCI